jgi:hypothetical protein
MGPEGCVAASAFGPAGLHVLLHVGVCLAACVLVGVVVGRRFALPVAIGFALLLARSEIPSATASAQAACPGPAHHVSSAKPPRL